MKKTALSLAAVTLGLLSMPPALAQTGSVLDKVARGKYIVNTAGCHDCHTPFKMGANGPEPDMSRALSGHPQELKMPPVPALPPGPWLVISSATNTAHAGPWGVSFTANLTPDRKTGLGEWTVQDFKATIRTGRHLGRGRAILPPMPIPVYNNLSDDDLESVFAYLRTIAPIENRVPEPWGPSAK
jgi:mono/diheme cytochrome c family protein